MCCDGSDVTNYGVASFLPTSTVQRTFSRVTWSRPAQCNGKLRKVSKALGATTTANVVSWHVIQVLLNNNNSLFLI